MCGGATSVVFGGGGGNFTPCPRPWVGPIRQTVSSPAIKWRMRYLTGDQWLPCQGTMARTEGRVSHPSITALGVAQLAIDDADNWPGYTGWNRHRPKPVRRFFPDFTSINAHLTTTCETVLCIYTRKSIPEFSYMLLFDLIHRFVLLLNGVACRPIWYSKYRQT